MLIYTFGDYGYKITVYKIVFLSQFIEVFLPMYVEEKIWSLDILLIVHL